MLTPVEDDGESSCSEMLEAEATEDEKNFEKLKGAVSHLPKFTCPNAPALIYLPLCTYKYALSEMKWTYIPTPTHKHRLSFINAPLTIVVLL